MSTMEIGGYLGLVVAALAAYIGLAELCGRCFPSSRWPSTDRPA